MASPELWPRWGRALGRWAKRSKEAGLQQDIKSQWFFFCCGMVQRCYLDCQSNVCALLYLTSNMRASTSQPDHACSNASRRAAEVGSLFFHWLHDFSLHVSCRMLLCRFEPSWMCLASGRRLRQGMKPHLIGWKVHHFHSFSDSLHASPRSRPSKGRSSCTIWILVFPTAGANAYCFVFMTKYWGNYFVWYFMIHKKRLLHWGQPDFVAANVCTFETPGGCFWRRAQETSAESAASIEPNRLVGALAEVQVFIFKVSVSVSVRCMLMMYANLEPHKSLRWESFGCTSYFMILWRYVSSDHQLLLLHQAWNSFSEDACNGLTHAKERMITKQVLTAAEVSRVRQIQLFVLQG